MAHRSLGGRCAVRAGRAGDGDSAKHKDDPSRSPVGSLWGCRGCACTPTSAAMRLGTVKRPPADAPVKRHGVWTRLRTSDRLGVAGIRIPLGTPMLATIRERCRRPAWRPCRLPGTETPTCPPETPAKTWAWSRAAWSRSAAPAGPADRGPRATRTPLRAAEPRGRTPGAPSGFAMPRRALWCRSVGAR